MFWLCYLVLVVLSLSPSIQAAKCTDAETTAAFTSVDRERTRLLDRCAIDVGSIPVQYLYNGTLKAKITDAQFAAFLDSSDCAALVTIEEKAWGTISPPCQVQFGSLSFSTAEISTWSFKEYAQRFYGRSIPSSTDAPTPSPSRTSTTPSGNGGGIATPSPSRTTGPPMAQAAASTPIVSLSLLLSLALARIV